MPKCVLTKKNDAVPNRYKYFNLCRIVSGQRAGICIHLSNFEHFVSILALSVRIIPVPAEVQDIEEERRIRDVNDRPILRAAIAEKVDGILTGDKDFLESGISYPKMITPAEFMKMG